MSSFTLISFLALAAAAGAVSRYFLGQFFTKFIQNAYWGTFFINVLGSLLLVVALVFMKKNTLTPDQYKIIGTGFLGAFTTYSLFNLELINIFEAGDYKAFFLYFLASFGVIFFVSLMAFRFLKSVV